MGLEDSGKWFFPFVCDARRVINTALQDTRDNMWMIIIVYP